MDPGTALVFTVVGGLIVWVVQTVLAARADDRGTQTEERSARAETREEHEALIRAYKEHRQLDSQRIEQLREERAAIETQAHRERESATVAIYSIAQAFTQRHEVLGAALDRMLELHRLRRAVHEREREHLTSDLLQTLSDVSGQAVDVFRVLPDADEVNHELWQVQFALATIQSLDAQASSQEAESELALLRASRIARAALGESKERFGTQLAETLANAERDLKELEDFAAETGKGAPGAAGEPLA